MSNFEIPFFTYYITGIPELKSHLGNLINAHNLFSMITLMKIALSSFIYKTNGSNKSN